MAKGSSIKKHIGKFLKCFESPWAIVIFVCSLLIAINPFTTIDFESMFNKGETSKEQTIKWNILGPSMATGLIVFFIIKIAQKGKKVANRVMGMIFFVHCLMFVGLYFSFNYIEDSFGRHLASGVFDVLEESMVDVGLVICIMVLGLNAETGYESFIINTLTSLNNFATLGTRLFVGSAIDNYISNHDYTDQSVKRIAVIAEIYSAAVMLPACVALFWSLKKTSSRPSGTEAGSPASNLTNRLLTDDIHLQPRQT